MLGLAISVVRLPAAAESDHFVIGAGTGTLSELDGDLLVSSYVHGLLQFDPESGTFVVGPGEGVTPEGAVNLLAAGTDSGGRIYAVAAGDCSAPGTVHVWEGTLGDVDAAVPVTVGSCPIDVVFTEF